MELSYNTKYVCSYNDSDVFLESELEVLNDHEKMFVRDALYRRDICNIFKIEDQCFDEKIINDNISKLYKYINGEKFLKSCIVKISEKFMNSFELEVGFLILFSFDYLYLAHSCISEYIDTGKIHDSNTSLIELKNKLF